MPRDCTQIVESVDPAVLVPALSTDTVIGAGENISAADFLLVSSPITSAGDRHLCYLSHRVDPASRTNIDDGGGFAQYNEVCLVGIGDGLYLVPFGRSAAPNTRLATLARPKKLGAIRSTGKIFGFYGPGKDADDATISGTPVAGTYNQLETEVRTSGSEYLDQMKPTTYGLTGANPTSVDVLPKSLYSRVRRVDVHLEVEAPPAAGGSVRRRSFDYSVTLRGAAYDSERCWTGARVVTDSNGNAVLTCPDPS